MLHDRAPGAGTEAPHVFFQQFYLESLGHASYLVGDEATGQALVLDPQRDVQPYVEAARRQGLRIVQALDTHGHNDYLSGLAELTARTGLTPLGSAAGELGYDHRPVKDGEVVELGDVAFEVLHTPGHTPEHVALLVRDLSVGEEPAMLLSGGSLLVGDLARPDLLGGPEDAQRAAAAFCRTLQDKILPLPDHVEVFPTHVAGSLCAGSIGSRLSTTVGYERRTNAVLARLSEATEYVESCMDTANLPAVPPYWRRMRTQNLQGVSLLPILADAPALQPDAFARLDADGAVVLDARSPEAFAAAHVPGAINVGLGASFPAWAGSVLAADTPILIVSERPQDVPEITWHLLRTGYDVPVGWLADGMHAWRTSARPVGRLSVTDVHGLREMISDDLVRVLDVRQPSEWAAGHIEGAQHLTGAELVARLDEIPADRPVATICGSGYRSSVAASVLAAAGREVTNVLGGMAAWNNAGYPTTS